MPVHESEGLWRNHLDGLMKRWTGFLILRDGFPNKGPGQLSATDNSDRPETIVGVNVLQTLPLLSDGFVLYFVVLCDSLNPKGFGPKRIR